MKAEIPDVPAGSYQVDGKGDSCNACGLGLQRNDDEYFLNLFRTIDAPTQKALSLRFSGLNRTGTFACGTAAKTGDDYAVKTALELWVTVNTKASPLTQYPSDRAGASCSVTVTKIDKTGAEGCYTATLIDGSGAKVEITGSFRGGPTG